MSSRELERVEVMGRVANKSLKLVHAAEILRLSDRQVKRLWKVYRHVAAAGLKHGHAGKPSNRAKPEKFRPKVLRLVAKKYSGSEEERFGPTLAAERWAEEDGLPIDAETLRRWMLAEDLWTRQRKRKAFGERRERKRHFGELVQLDGSFHDWLEERGPKGCLMDMVDDATSTVLGRLGVQETIWAAVGVLRAWIVQYGVPQALYTDWKNVYKRPASEAERLRGEAPLTQFGRMCQRLGIEIIAASSPQAKGAGGKKPRDSSGSLGEEVTAKRTGKPCRGQMSTWRGNICRSTIDALRKPRRSRRTTTDAGQAPPSCAGSSAWRPNRESATIGWCGIMGDSCNCNPSIATTVRRRPKRLFGSGKTAPWRCTTAGNVSLTKNWPRLPGNKSWRTERKGPSQWFRG
jgi:hypothetical protein